MKRLLFILSLLPLFAEAQDIKTPFATTASPVAKRFAFTNNGLWADSVLKLPFYKQVSDTVLIGFDTAGKAYRITKSQIAGWTSGNGTTIFDTTYLYLTTLPKYLLQSTYAGDTSTWNATRAWINDQLASKQDTLGYLPENQALKMNDNTMSSVDTTRYPSVPSVRIFVDSVTNALTRTLQQVTDIGATTTNGITITGRTPTTGWGTNHLDLVHDGSPGIGGSPDNSMSIINTGNGGQSISFIDIPNVSPTTNQVVQMYHYHNLGFEINSQGANSGVAYKYIPFSIHRLNVAGYSVLIGGDNSLGALIQAGTNRLWVRSSTMGSSENILNLVDSAKISKFRVQANGGISASVPTSDGGSSIVISNNTTPQIPTQGSSVSIGGRITNPGNSGYSVNINGIEYGGGDSYFNTILGYDAKIATDAPKSTVLGAKAEVSGANNVSIGYNSRAGGRSIAIGSEATSTGQLSASFGAVNTEDSVYSYGPSPFGVDLINHKFNGWVYVSRLRTTDTVPKSVGVTKMVTTDQNGMLSFADIPRGSDGAFLTCADSALRYYTPRQVDTYRISKQPFINVKDYGAIGDSLTDNTAAFQNAVDALPNGGTLVIPTSAKPYLINKVDVTGKQNVTITGPGTLKLLNNDNDAVFYVTNCYRPTFTNIKFIGIGGEDSTATGSKHMAIYCDQSSFLGVNNCDFTQFNHYAIRTQDMNGGTFTEGSEIYYNVFHDFPFDEATAEGQYAIYMGADAEYSRIHDNKFYRVVHCVDFEDGANSDFYDNIGMQLKSTSTSGTQYTERAFVYAVNASNNAKIRIRGNTFNHNNVNSLIFALYGGGSQPYYELSGNTCLVNGDGLTTRIGLFNGLRSPIVTNNIFNNDAGRTPPNPADVLYFNNCTDALFSNNFIIDGGYGVSLVSSSMQACQNSFYNQVLGQFDVDGLSSLTECASKDYVDSSVASLQPTLADVTASGNSTLDSISIGYAGAPALPLLVVGAGDESGIIGARALDGTVNPGVFLKTNVSTSSGILDFSGSGPVTGRVKVSGTDAMVLNNDLSITTTSSLASTQLKSTAPNTGSSTDLPIVWNSTDKEFKTLSQLTQSQVSDLQDSLNKHIRQGSITGTTLILRKYNGDTIHVDGLTSGSGSGTVTNFSAGDLSPLFITNETNTTTTPVLSFNLSSAGAHKFFGNNTGSSAAPDYYLLGKADLPGKTVYSDQNNTMDAGVTLGVQSDGTNPGFRDIGSSSDPSSLNAGAFWYNTTSNAFKGRFNATTRQFVTTDGTETLTNKTIDGDNNTLQDIQFSALKTGTIAEYITLAISDETTDITSGTAKITFRMPFAATITGVRASLNSASSSGNPIFDVNESGTSILSTKLTIDAGEKTSTTAAIPPVVSDSSISDDAEITIDIDAAGTGVKGAKITIYYTR